MKKIFLIATLFAAYSCNQNGTDSTANSNGTTQTTTSSNQEGQDLDPDLITNKKSASGKNGKTREPIFKFEEEEWDFGTLEDGQVVSHKFKFKNVGNADLIIQSATASCGCTIPKYSRDPIAPGEWGELPVEFNSKGKASGVPITKDINIIANTNPVQKIIRIKMIVIEKK